MRFGISAALTTASARDWAEAHRALGCGAVVFPFDHTADANTVADYADAARDAGLVIAEVGAWCNPVSPDAAERKRSLERCKAQLRLADEIGARCCVNIAGSDGPRWDGAYPGNFTDRHWLTTVASIREIIDAVKPKRTFYTLEPMPWMLPRNPEEYLRLIKAVDRERFAVHMDLANWMTSAEKLFGSGDFANECFDALGGYIRSCHLKDVALAPEFTLRLIETRVGEGSMDHAAYFRRADQCDPDMPMLLEHLPSDDIYKEDLRKARDLYNGLGCHGGNERSGG
ncbi:MAG: sugar phosphate isomerase/epimerase [Oscillospiraceae bacterium]|jgi:sugar phosphate isomerase/epimerase|nr:sugar phosphate isomerase/epimerase [Oscillospiraceae bacterium]